jgi:hypothetical protein
MARPLSDTSGERMCPFMCADADAVCGQADRSVSIEVSGDKTKLGGAFAEKYGQEREPLGQDNPEFWGGILGEVARGRASG